MKQPYSLFDYYFLVEYYISIASRNFYSDTSESIIQTKQVMFCGYLKSLSPNTKHHLDSIKFLNNSVNFIRFNSFITLCLKINNSDALCEEQIYYFNNVLQIISCPMFE